MRKLLYRSLNLLVAALLLLSFVPVAAALPASAPNAGDSVSTAGSGGQASQSAAPSTARPMAVVQERIMVLLADFADVHHGSIVAPSASDNSTYWRTPFSADHYMDRFFRASDSLRNYFLENSYSQFDIVSVPFTAPTNGSVVLDWGAIVAPQNAAVYGDDDAIAGYDRLSPFTVDDFATYAVTTGGTALAALPGWAAGTWAQFDRNSDGLVDHLVIVHAGKGQEEGGGVNTIVSGLNTFSSPVAIGGGLSVGQYIVVPEDVTVGKLAELLAKQMGAVYTGNPTALYGAADNGANESSAAFWDLMSAGRFLGNKVGTSPADMNLRQRMNLGWVTAGDLVPLSVTTSSAANITLSKVEGSTTYNWGAKVALPDYTPVRPHSGSWFWWSGKNASTTSSMRMTVPMPPAGSAATLQFWTYYDTEAAVDLCRVQVSTNMEVWTTVDTFSGLSGGWVQKTYDLRPYMAGTGNLYVRLYATSDAARTGLGWFADDFTFTANSPYNWTDDVEAGVGGWTVSGEGGWARVNAPSFTHYYLVEWRSQTGFDAGYNAAAYYMTNTSTKAASYYSYNPGMLIWYVNERWNPGENDPTFRPGEGYMLPVDAHPSPLPSGGSPWGARVQMLDAPFNTDATIAQSILGFSLGGLAAVNEFNDTNSYYNAAIPGNSVKIPTYGVHLKVEQHAADMAWGKIGFWLDAGNFSTSTKTADKVTVQPGQQLTYTVTIRNTGVADCYTANMTDTLPLHTTFGGTVTATSGSVSYDDANRAIRWVGTALKNVPVTITFNVNVNSPQPNGGQLINNAQIYEGTTLDYTASCSVGIVSSPNLNASWKSVAPATVRAGDPLTWTVVLTNTGTDNAIVDLSDTVPALTTYVVGSATATTGTLTLPGSQLLWHGPVNVGEPVTITFRSRVNPGTAAGTSITNIATINDHIHAAFTKTATATVISGANFSGSTKTVNKTSANAGEVLTYTITIPNSGNLSGTTLMTDVVPSGTTYVTGTVTGGGVYNGGTDTITWSGTLAPLASRTITFRARIDVPVMNGTIITNTAEIDDVGTVITRTATTTVSSAPDLSSAIKEVQASSAASGGVLTYTVTMTNTGTEVREICVTDVVPTHTEMITTSLAFSAGAGGYDPGSRTIQWCVDELGLNTPVSMTFAVTITLAPTETGIITNTAWINDGVHPPFPRSVTTHVAMLSLGCPTITPYSGELFDIPMNIANVANLMGYAVRLNFDPARMELVSISRSSWFTPAVPPVTSWDNTAGVIDLATVLAAQTVGKSGTGLLATFTFRAKAGGPITLTFGSSDLSDTFGEPPFIGFIPHNTNTCASGSVIGRQVTGRVEMQGRTNQSGVSVFANGVLVGTTDATGNYTFDTPASSFTLRMEKVGYLWAQRSVTVGHTTLITMPYLLLNGGDVVGGNMIVTRAITCTVSPSTTVEIPGNPEGTVNMQDLTMVGTHYGMRSTDPWWGPNPCYPEYGAWDVRNYDIAYRADVNGDGIVNLVDLVAVGTNFNKTAPSPWP